MTRANKKLALKATIALCFSFICLAKATNIEYTPMHSTSIIAYAEDDVPNNTPVYPGDDSNTDDGRKPKKPDAYDVFGDVSVGEDTTGLSDTFGAALQAGTNMLVKACNLLFIFALICHFAVESCMMAFPSIANLMATKVPVQLFSNECAAACGVKYSYRPGGGGPGGPGGGPGSAAADAGGGPGGNGPNAKNKSFAAKFSVYFKERMITLILCGTALVMTTTGILPWLINTCINWLIGLFFK